MSSPNNLPLPNGYTLLNYTIVKQLSSGGFSIVYLAHDEHKHPVAIKEYLPQTLSIREQGPKVLLTSPEHAALFRHGMKCFFEEGKSLAAINHPNIVRVINFFRANETVYMVMEYELGRTLQKEVQVSNGHVKENLLLYVFAHLLNGLREVHLRKLLHLDIKPANIYIRRDGSPVLLDFGSARQALGFQGNKLSPTYTPGFASPEHYQQERDKIGPWTDNYSIGASLFTCMSGTAPQPADQRTKEDAYVPVAKAWAGRYSPGLLEIVDWCLQLDPLKRPQSVHELQKALLATANSPENTLKKDGGFMQELRSSIQKLGHIMTRRDK